MSVLPVTDVQWWTVLGTHVCDCDVSIASHWCTVMNITRDMYITRHTCLWLLVMSVLPVTDVQWWRQLTVRRPLWDVHHLALPLGMFACSVSLRKYCKQENLVLCEHSPVCPGVAVTGLAVPVCPGVAVTGLAVPVSRCCCDRAGCTCVQVLLWQGWLYLCVQVLLWQGWLYLCVQVSLWQGWLYLCPGVAVTGLAVPVCPGVTVTGLAVPVSRCCCDRTGCTCVSRCCCDRAGCTCVSRCCCDRAGCTCVSRCCCDRTGCTCAQPGRWSARKTWSYSALCQLDRRCLPLFMWSLTFFEAYVEHTVCVPHTLLITNEAVKWAFVKWVYLGHDGRMQSLRPLLNAVAMSWSDSLQKLSGQLSRSENQHPNMQWIVVAVNSLWYYFSTCFCSCRTEAVMLLLTTLFLCCILFRIWHYSLTCDSATSSCTKWMDLGCTRHWDAFHGEEERDRCLNSRTTGRLLPLTTVRH